MMTGTAPVRRERRGSARTPKSKGSFLMRLLGNCDVFALYVTKGGRGGWGNRGSRGPERRGEEMMVTMETTGLELTDCANRGSD